MKIVLYLVLLFEVFSCSLYFRKNNQLVEDYEYLSSDEFAKKYFTLHKEKNELIDSAILQKVYYSPQNNGSAKFICFSENKYTYESLPFQIYKDITKSFNAIKNIKLTRRDYYTIQDSIINIESIARSSGSVYTVIREGIIKEEKIDFNKQYSGRGMMKRKIKEEMIHIKELQILRLGDYYYIGSK